MVSKSKAEMTRKYEEGKHKYLSMEEVRKVGHDESEGR